MCFTVLASLGQHFVLLGSRLLWVPPHPLCSSAFVSWLLWDSLRFVRDPASLGPPPLLCALLSRLLWDNIYGTSFSRVLAYLGPFPSFLEIHGLGDFDAPLDSVALVSLIECISRALAGIAWTSLGQSFAGPGLSGSIPIPCVLLLFCLGFSGTAFAFLGSRLL